MSERESEEGAAEGVAAQAEPDSTPAVEPARPPSGSPKGFPRSALWLAGLLILILAGVARSPFWAPQIEPLLPWGENRDDYAALAHLDLVDTAIAVLLAVAATLAAGLYPTWRAAQSQPAWQLKVQ